MMWAVESNGDWPTTVMVLGLFLFTAFLIWINNR